MKGDIKDLKHKAVEPKEGSGAEPEGEGQSMASLLEEQTEFHSKLEKREVVWVKVIQVLADQVLVDIGEKSEATVPVSEFTEAEAPVAGRRIPAILVKRGHGDRQTVLSTAKARWRLGWDQAVKSFGDKARVRGKVTAAVKGGFLVDVSGVTGFMPSSLSDLRPVRKPQALIGTGVRCYIVELNQEKGQMILSRKAVLEEETTKRKTKILSELKVGALRIGRVTRVSESGLFADIGGLEGLIHVADVAWKDPEAVKSKIERGAKVRVRVLRIEGDKVSLGMKQLTAHPGDILRKRYPIKSVVKGKVTEVLPDGVRIAISKTDNAFCPVTELQVEGVEPVRDKWEKNKGPQLPPIWPKVGDNATGIVTGIHAPTFEVAVSIKRFEAIQDRKHVARYMKGAPPLTLGQLLNPEEE